MPRYRWDDRVVAFQARITEIEGYRVGRYVNARATAWAVFTVTAVPAFLFLRAAGTGLVMSLTLTALVGGLCGKVGADALRAETGPLGWVMVAAAEARTAWRRAQHRPPVAARVTYRRPATALTPRWPWQRRTPEAP